MSLRIPRGAPTSALSAGLERLLAQCPEHEAVARMEVRGHPADSRGIQLALFA
jgi:hypothetical protein